MDASASAGKNEEATILGEKASLSGEWKIWNDSRLAADIQAIRYRAMNHQRSTIELDMTPQHHTTTPRKAMARLGRALSLFCWLACLHCHFIRFADC